MESLLDVKRVAVCSGKLVDLLAVCFVEFLKADNCAHDFRVVSELFGFGEDFAHVGADLCHLVLEALYAVDEGLKLRGVDVRILFNYFFYHCSPFFYCKSLKVIYHIATLLV